MKQEAQQALEQLAALSAQTLTDDDLQAWAALGSRLGFPTPLPEKPALPVAPQKPDQGAPPREDDPKYGVELSMLDKLLSSRRIKKQDAALKRFEKDRKAWNENRDYARGIYEKAENKHRVSVAELEAAYQAALDQWKDDFETYLTTLAYRAA
jgi:hypothetical protein